VDRPNADVIVGGGRVTENGSPRTTADGAAEWRVAALPASQWQVLDTWNPIGLAGSGSHDYMIADTFVPTANTWVHGRRNRPETLYAWRGMFVVNLVGVPLGFALEACDVATSILAGKVIMPEMIPAKNTPRVQVGIARARAMVDSARSYVYDTVGNFWTALEAGNEPSFEQRAQLAGCYVHTISECHSAAQLLVDTVGSAAIHKTCPLERHLRDLTAMARHIQGQVRMWEWAGGMYLGQPPSNPVV
jgi:alkylation response protein AidB-like acyl-CoA dehydrogenase